MKKTTLLFVLIILLLLLSACSSIPSGYVSKEEHFEQGGSQDYTDYAKYVYESSSAFEKNSDYSPVSESDINIIKGYTDNFKDWMSTENRLSEYDFNDSSITEGDYYRLKVKYNDNSYSDYTLWFFDTETFTLYYFHNNI